MRKSKKWATAMGAMVLTAAISIGGTYAFFSSVTPETINTFTSSKGIVTELVEEFSDTEAKAYVPNLQIAKIPSIMNQSTSLSIYTAMSVDYQIEKATVDLKEFNKIAYITFGAKQNQKIDTNSINSEKWELIARSGKGRELYMYKQELAVGSSTPCLFDGVRINRNLNENFQNGGDTEERDALLPSFDIVLKGYSVQYKTVPYEEAREYLINLANENGTVVGDEYISIK